MKYVNTVTETRTMYNLDVAVADTFFVGTQGWLVHNQNGPNTSYTVKPSQVGLDRIKQHLSGERAASFNDAMIKRIETALRNGTKLAGADANFYLHEIHESRLMAKGMGYEDAHAAAKARYKHTEFDLYHKDVIKALPKEFNPSWLKYWENGC